MIAADGLPGPRIFTTGPHIDGEHPAYPADAVVARDPEEARRLAERNRRARGVGAEDLLPAAAGERQRGDRRLHARTTFPCTAHLELLDARELLRRRPARRRAHHVVRCRACCRGWRPRPTGSPSSPDNDARRDGRYALFADANLDGPEAKALYAMLRERRPWLDPTLAVFERRADRPPKGTKPAMAPVLAAGFAKMQQLTRRAAARRRARRDGRTHRGARLPARGEAPWRELELLVDSGFTPLEAHHGRHRHGGGVSLSRPTSSARCGRASGRPRRASAAIRPPTSPPFAPSSA